MDEEGISKLPVPILHHILSFLSDKKAVGTCVLSKSWRHLVSTRPKFSLKECYFGEDKEKFRNVLDKSLQVYSDQKLCIDDFSVKASLVVPELEMLLKKWIPIVIQDLGAKKFDLSFGPRNSAYFDLPAVVFESESLQELHLHKCNLSQINSFGNNRHLKTLHLYDVYIGEEETFGKLMSSCFLIERFYLKDCKGSFRTIKMHNHHNLKRFALSNKDDDGSNIEIYLPSAIGYIFIERCRNWLHHRNYFPGLTCLRLESVPLSNDWFDSLSCNFPCLEELRLSRCSGFDELKLSSRSIEILDITMLESTIKATIDAPSIKKFRYVANISQSISFTATTSNEWKSEIQLELNNQVSQWFLKICELFAALSQSQINSLALSDLKLSDCVRGKQHNFEHLSDHIPVCCGSHELPVAIGSLELDLAGHYYKSFFSDLVNGLFRIFRPREIKHSFSVFKNAQDEENQNNRNEVNAKEEKHHAAVELLCKILFTGKLKEQAMFCWKIGLESFDPDENEWHLVQETIGCSDCVAALLKKPGFHQLRIRLKWSARLKYRFLQRIMSFFGKIKPCNVLFK